MDIPTPTRGEVSPQSTPIKSPDGDNVASLGDLSANFHRLALRPSGLAKRGADSMTIEGSPLNTSRIFMPKRLDTNETPRHFKHFVASVPPSSASNIYVLVASSTEEHNTRDHQENAQRTALLTGPEGCLKRYPVSERIEWVPSDSIQPATLADILRVHEYTYYKHLEAKCAATSGSLIGAIPPFYAPVGQLDADTPLSPQSLHAARMFSGAAIRAVDCVLNERDTISDLREENAPRAAFVVGRPPGHHAGPNGCVVSKHYWLRPDMASSGFCLLNTAYARYNYSKQGATFVRGHSAISRPLKIAIIDIDVHHGNGTEEIVRNLVPHETYLPLPSSWAPVSTLSYKPWLNDKDADDVLFSSINLYAGERFYPCSGNDTHVEAVVGDHKNIINIALTPVGPGPWDLKGRGKLTPQQRIDLCQQAGNELRYKVTEYLLPKLRVHQPDLLFFSSGFDAHYDDMYHFLTEDDYYWMTKAIGDVVHANGGRIVSVLEGGYSLSSPILTPRQKAPTPAGAGKPKKKGVKATDDKDDVIFAQVQNDGGLVKGVLSHVAALACVDNWISKNDQQDGIADKSEIE